MATIGSIDVAIRAQTEAFRKGIASAKRSIGDLKNSIPGLNFAFSKMGALTASIAGGGLALLVKRKMEAIDATAKLADRIGTTTEALVGLQHAAELSGPGAEALNKGLEMMTRRIGEAAQGLGEGKHALEALGLSVSDLLGKDPAEAFKEIAERVSHLGSQQEKAAISAQLFGRAGVELVNVLEEGRGGLEKMQAEAERLGKTFTRIDAAKVEAANDAMTRAGTVLEGLTTQVAIELSPFVEALANKFTELGTSAGGMRNKVIDAVEGMTKAVAAFAGIADGALATVQLGLKGIAMGAVISERSFLGLLEATTGKGAMEKMQDAFTSAVNVVRVLNGLEKQEPRPSTRQSRVVELNKEFEKLEKEIGALGERISDGFGGERAKEIEAYFKSIRDGADAAAEKLFVLSFFGQKWVGIGLATSGGIGGLTEKAKENTKQIAAFTDDWRKAIEGVQDIFKEIIEKQGQFVQNLEREIALLTEKDDKLREAKRLSFEIEDLRKEGAALGLSETALDDLLGRFRGARMDELHARFEEEGKKIGEKMARGMGEGLRRNSDELVRAIDAQLRGGLTELIADGIETGFENGAEIAKRIWSQLLRTLIDDLVGSGLNSILGKVGGGGGGGGLFSALFSGLSSIFGGGGTSTLSSAVASVGSSGFLEPISQTDVGAALCPT